MQLPFEVEYPSRVSASALAVKRNLPDAVEMGKSWEFSVPCRAALWPIFWPIPQCVGHVLAKLLIVSPLFANEPAATSFEAPKTKTKPSPGPPTHIALLHFGAADWSFLLLSANWFIYCVRLFWNNFMLICLLIAPPAPSMCLAPFCECASVCVSVCVWLKDWAPMMCEVLAAPFAFPADDVCFAAAAAAAVVHWLLMSLGIRWFSAAAPA